LRNFGGAKVRRVVYRSAARIGEHAHDWPLLSLFVLGGCSNETEHGETFVAGPSATLYRAGAAHRNVVGPLGFEQIEIAFDPAWLGYMPDAPVSQWLSGRAGAEARSLAWLCSTDPDEMQLRAAVRQFVERADREARRDRPGWVDTITRRLRKNPALRADDLARDVRRHPSWLGTAYRRATGEGLAETAARFRVEHAARLLRETDQSGATIAADAGFCDQSHMNRTFRRVLGRLPSAVRADRSEFRCARSTQHLKK
jgi:AraC family transcriptional regulator